MTNEKLFPVRADVAFNPHEREARDKGKTNTGVHLDVLLIHTSVKLVTLWQRYETWLKDF